MDFRLGPAYAHAASLARAGDSPRVCIVGRPWATRRTG